MRQETKQYAVVAFLISLVIYFPSPSLLIYAGLVLVTTFYGAVIGNTVAAIRSYEADQARYVKIFVALGGGIPLLSALSLVGLQAGTLFDTVHFPLEPLQVFGWLFLLIINGTVFGAALGRGGYRLRNKLGIDTGIKNILYTLIIVGVAVFLVLLPGLTLIVLGGGNLSYFPVEYRNTFTGDCISADYDFMPWYWERDQSCAGGGPYGRNSVQQECSQLAKKIDDYYCSQYVDPTQDAACSDTSRNPSSKYTTTAYEEGCNWYAQADNVTQIQQFLTDPADVTAEEATSRLEPLVHVRGNRYNCVQEGHISPVCPASR